MRAPESLIPVLEQLCTVLEQLCRVEADKLTVVSADHPDQLESLLNDENMLLLQLRGLDKKRSDLLRRSGLEGLTFRQILMWRTARRLWHFSLRSWNGYPSRLKS